MIELLKRPQAIKLQLLWHIYVARINRQVYRCHEQVYGKFVNRNCHVDNNVEQENDRNVSGVQLASTAVRPMHRLASQWHWEKWPKVWPILNLYQGVSSLWMSYTVIRHIFWDYIHATVSLFPLEKPAHCYILGRFEFHESANDVTGLVLSLLHLSWRTGQYYIARPYMLNLVTFMMQDERDIEKFYTMIERGLLPDLQHGSQISDGGRDDSYQQLLCQLMCYRMHHRSGISYKLRPNRTKKARSILRERIAKTTLLIGTLFAIAAIIVTTVIIASVARDKRYLRAYPNCNLRLKKLNEEGKVGEWSVTVDAHHLWSGIADGLENGIIWIDSGLAISFVMLLAYLLNYDLLIYWRLLHSKIIETLNETLASYLLRNGPQLDLTLGPPDTSSYRGPIGIQSILNEPHAWSVLHYCNNCVAKPRFPIKLRRKMTKSVPNFKLDYLVLDTQSEIQDFFHEIKRVDMFVSDILTFSLLIWLLTFTLYGEISLTYYFSSRKADIPFIILAAQVIAFFAVFVASHYLLELNRCCMRSYQAICSLMAYDRSRHRRKFIKILEFYTEHHRSYYTLFQQHPYSATTFLSIIGWSVSCFLVFDGLFRNRHS